MRRDASAEQEIVELVQTGVERFILKNATVEEFLRTMRNVSEKEKSYAHQLTGPVFTKIIKAAIRKRKIRQSK